jgi:hypothetical protein
MADTTPQTVSKITSGATTGMQASLLNSGKI